MLVLLVTSLIAISQAQADSPDYNIRGEVLVNNGKMFLVEPGEEKIELTTNNENVKADLASLESGDFISGHGDKSAKLASLDTIEFIGLRRLLGKWIDRDRHLMFSFQSFSDAAVRLLSQSVEKQLQYALVPDQANRWTIFLGDTQSVAVGTLTHTKNMVRIDLINAETGMIEQSMRLQALRP